MPDDKIQREIEDILNRLDNFVPDEKVTPFRRRASPNAGSVLHALLAPIAGISLRQVMMTSLVLILIGFIGMRVDPIIGEWALIGGVILFLTTLALSIFHKSAPPATEKRWRGQAIDLSEPTLGDRFRTWLQNKKRNRY